VSASPGYSVANFKIFAFCMAAIFAAIGGAMFTLKSASCRRPLSARVPSIEMVIYTRSAAGSISAGLRDAAGELRQDTYRNPFRSSGCSASARCSSPSCWPSRTGSPYLAGLRATAHRPAVRLAQTQIRQRLDRQFGCRRRAGE